MKKAFLVCLLFLVGFPLYSQWTVDELYNYYEPEGDFSLPKKIEIKGKYTTEDATAKNCKFWVMHYDDIFFSLRIFENVNSPDETFIGEGREVNVFIRKPSGWYVKTIFETRKYGITKAVSREMKIQKSNEISAFGGLNFVLENLKSLSLDYSLTVNTKSA